MIKMITGSNSQNKILILFPTLQYKNASFQQVPESQAQLRQ